MDSGRWERIGAYIREVFGAEDEHLASIMPRAIEAGLPDIAVSAEVGRLLQILASLTNGGLGAGLAVELGTLAGYSAIWIARGLAPGGRLITVESESSHARFAAGELERAGVSDRVEIKVASALASLAALREEFGDESLDFVFIDAAKEEYPEYLRLVRPMLKVGGVLVADNALGSNTWVVDEAGGASREGVDRFNRMLASDRGFIAACVPLRQGLAIARRI